MIKLFYTCNFILLVMLNPYSGMAQNEWNYGLSASLNYPTIGTEISNYTGRGLGSFTGFVSRPFNPYHSNRFLNKLSFMLEPGISFVGIREQQADIRYTNDYFDFTGYVYMQPDYYNDAILFFAGVRPSILINSSSEVFELGEFVLKENFSSNHNKAGRIDVGAVAGVSFSLGEVVHFELRYVHSFTSNSTAGYIEGRPGMIEAGLRVSGLDIRNKLLRQNEALTRQITRYSKGTLLVMLLTPNRQEEEILAATDRKTEISGYRSYIRLTNETVIKQFRQEFGFCKLLFFMDTSAYRVSAKNFNNVFVNDHMEPVQPSDFDSTNFFVASFCEDLSSHTKKFEYGLYVYTDKMDQLGKPYNVPYNMLPVFADGDPLNYIRKRRQLYDTGDYTRVIRKFNNRLNRYRE